MASPCSFLTQLLVAQVAKGLGTTSASVGTCSGQISLGDAAGPAGERRGSRQLQMYQQRSVSISMREWEPQCFTTALKLQGRHSKCLVTARKDSDGLQLPDDRKEPDKYPLRCRTPLMM